MHENPFYVSAPQHAKPVVPKTSSLDHFSLFDVTLNNLLHHQGSK